MFANVLEAERTQCRIIMESSSGKASGEEEPVTPSQIASFELDLKSVVSKSKGRSLVQSGTGLEISSEPYRGIARKPHLNKTRSTFSLV
jgi:hypothetical protein